MSDTVAPAQAVIDQLVGAAHGDLPTVRRLLAEHPEITNASASWGETAIQAAAQMGREDIATLLLAAGAPMDICTAAALGRAGVVEQMLADDPGLAHATGAHGIPFLYFPAIADRVDIAEIALARGAEVNAGAGGNTPLHGAAMFGRAEMARWLLEHGANLAALDYQGKTALQVAGDAGHDAVVEVLRAVSEGNSATGS